MAKPAVVPDRGTPDPAEAFPDSSAAVLTASRALLGVVARSLAPAFDEVSLPQFRVLVVLAAAGHPVRSGAIADELGVHPSTFSRTADRLEAGDWVQRVENPDSRRETLVELRPKGRRLVALVTRTRLEEIGHILDRADDADRDLIVAGLEAFARAAGEPSVGDLSALGM